MKNKPTADQYLLHKLYPTLKRARNYAETDAFNTNESTMARCFDDLMKSIEKLPFLFPNNSIEITLDKIISTIKEIKTCIRVESSFNLNIYNRIIDKTNYLRLREKYINLLDALLY